MPRPTQIVRTPMAQAVRRFRASLGLTQKEFAKRAQLTPITIARYETNSMPSGKVLQKMADIARKAGLPLFVEIFEGRVAADTEAFEQQELDAMLSAVKASLDNPSRGRFGYR